MKSRSIPTHLSTNFPKGFNFRRYYPDTQKSYRFHVSKQNFSLFTQNMALMAAQPTPEGLLYTYKGANRREDSVAEIIKQLRIMSVDVAGLCEVFYDGEREEIRDAVKDIYPYWQEGPDEDDMDSDGGLLLLSKHPFLQTDRIIYRDTKGGDSWANKGVLYVRIHPPNLPLPVDVFYTHAQDMDANDDAPAALYQQLEVLQLFIEEKSESEIPVFIMGDLNIRGDEPDVFREMITRLKGPADLWLTDGNAPADGCTNVRENNFFSEPEVLQVVASQQADFRPKKNHRLDFILMKADPLFIPLLQKIQVIKFMLNNRNLSDHFGLHAHFNQFLRVTKF